MRAADCKKLAEKPEGVFRQAKKTEALSLRFYRCLNQTFLLRPGVEGERGSGGDLIAVLNNAAKKTALTSCSVDYTYKVDGTPSVAEPSIISVIGNQLGLVMLDADEVEATQ